MIGNLLLIIGLALVIGSYVYDQKKGRSEEYGPLAYGIVGLLIFLVGMIVKAITWIIGLNS